MAKRVLAEISLASLLAGGWIAGCYLAATLAASFLTRWWETEAWRAWWVALPIGAASLAAVLVASYSERLRADRPARILLRGTLVLAVAALGLAVQAMLPTRLNPGFFLSYPQPGSGSAPMVLAGALAVASALLAAALKSRAQIKYTNRGVSEQTSPTIL